jgi:plasmid stability protein
MLIVGYGNGVEMVLIVSSGWFLLERCVRAEALASAANSTISYDIIATEAITMPAIIIRNLSVPVHNALRRIAAERRMSVEALARAALGDLARQAGADGIDFAKLARDRAALGLTEDGPEWTEALDDPALSRRVLAPDGE